MLTVRSTDHSRDTAASRRRAILIVALALGTLYASVQISLRAAAKRVPYHDDAISVLAATCHQGSYEPQELTGAWVPASRWQAYTTPDELGCFATISRGLAKRDIHPPLYFWLLHLWIHAFSASLSAIAVLTILLHSAVALAIAWICWRLGCSTPACTCASLAWLLGGSTMYVADDIRQYSLLALVTLIFFAAILAYLRTGSARKLIWVYLVSTAGFLTHYHFALALSITCALAGIILLRRSDLRRCLALGSVAVLSLGSLFLLHPGAWASINRVTGQELPTSEIPERIERAIATLVELALPRTVGRFAGDQILAHWHIAAVFFAVVAGVIAYRRRARLPTILDTRERLPLPAAVLLLAAICLLYISLSGPSHAMGPKYVVIATPILFVAMGQLVSSLPDRHHQLLIAIVAIASQAVISGQTSYKRYRTHLSTAPMLRAGVPIVLDTTARGVLPVVLWPADGETSVLATAQETLRREIPELPGESVYYFSGTHGGNTETGRDDILAGFARRGFQVASVKKLRSVPGQLYELKTNDPDAPSKARPGLD